jgi:hypothetical protein
MSALSPINTGAPALFRFAHRFFKKILDRESAQRRTNFHPQGGTLFRSCRAIVGMRQMARTAPCCRGRPVHLLSEMKRNNNLRLVGSARPTSQLPFHLDIIG